MPTDFSTQEEDWKSRLSRAMALQGQLGQTQQGQMVSGHYVPNYGGIIAGLVNSFIGQRQEKDARAGLDALGKERRKASAQQIGNLFNPQAVQPQVQQTALPEQPAPQSNLPAHIPTQSGAARNTPEQDAQGMQQWGQNVQALQQQDAQANQQFQEQAAQQTVANNKQALADALISQDENVRAAAMQILKGQQEAGKAGSGTEYYDTPQRVWDPVKKGWRTFRVPKNRPELEEIQLPGYRPEETTVIDGKIVPKVAGDYARDYGPIRKEGPGVYAARESGTNKPMIVTPTPDPIRSLEYSSKKEQAKIATEFLNEQQKKAIAGQALTHKLVKLSNLMNSDAGVMSGMAMPVQKFAYSLASSVGLQLTPEQKQKLANTESAKSALADMLPSVFAQVPGKSVDADAEAKRILAQLPDLNWTPAAQREVINRLIESATVEGRTYDTLRKKYQMAQKTGNWDDVLLEFSEMQSLYGTEDAAAQVQPPTATGGFNWVKGRPQ